MTPPQTIVEMICLNPSFQKIWQELYGKLNSGKPLGDSYISLMKDANNDLSTPNSVRQIEAAKSWNFTPEDKQIKMMNKIITETDTNGALELLTKPKTM